MNGSLPPAVIRVAPYWELRDLKRVAELINRDYSNRFKNGAG